MLLLGLRAGVAHAQEEPTFADIAPLLREHCLLCHQGASAPRGLRLDSYAALMRGSDKHRVVRPGRPERSELVHRLKGDSLPRMPMAGPPWLPDESVKRIERWIAAGAPEGTPLGTLSLRRPGDPVTYRDVAPLLAGRCVTCHTVAGLIEQPPENYRLDSYEHALSTAEWARIVPGRPEASELIRRVRGIALRRMPADAPPYLSLAEQQLLEQWVAQGARDESGKPAPIVEGARVRLHGRLDKHGKLDGLALGEGQRWRAMRGLYVEVLGVLRADGTLAVESVEQRVPRY